MAKSKPQSSKSRAARRQSSPSLDVDKSLATVPRLESEVIQRDSILADRANAGVTKKQAKPKPKSRSQRFRQQKGLERAEIVIDQLEKKVAGSVKRGKNVKSRRADWDDLNKANASKFAILQAQSGEDGHGDDAMVEDNSTTPTPDNAPSKPARTSQPMQAVQMAMAAEHPDVDEDDEIT